MAGYLRLEIARTVRDVRYVVLALAAPVGFYLLFAEIFSGRQAGGPGLPASVQVMVAMAAFGAEWGALFATAPRLARDRESGWLDVLRVTPLPAGQVLAARVCAGLLTSLPAVLAVGIAARLAHGVQLTAGQWGAGLLAVWLGVLPFVMLGIVIGTLTDSTTAYGLTLGTYFALAALGGLWVPPAIFPAVLRHVAEALPTYSQADLGWRIAAGAAPAVSSITVLAAWTAGLATVAAWAGAGARSPLTRRLASSPPSAPAARLADVSCAFGAVRALDELSLDIHRGTIVALLGPNGAGKTTTMRVLLGLLAPGQGQASLFGVPPASAIAAGLVGAMLQDAGLMSGVTVGALLRCIRGLYPDPMDYDAALALSGLQEISKRRTDRLSTGQAQRVRFAVALIGNPGLLVLDEPTAGMDVQAQQVFWDDVRSCQARGQTVLFSSHYLEEADHNAGRIIVIQAGRTVADGTPGQVRDAGGSTTIVRFTWTSEPPSDLDQLPGVTGIDRQGNQITLRTTSPEETVWSLYGQRHHITGLEVTSGGLREAFLALTATTPARGPRV